MTAIATGWLNDGTVARLEAEKRADARRRQAVARNVLDGLDLVGHPSSYFLWLPLPGEARADQVAAALMRETVSVSTAEPFATTKNPPHAIRLALGSVALDVLAESLEKVKRVIDAYTVLMRPLGCEHQHRFASVCGSFGQIDCLAILFDGEWASPGGAMG